MPEYCVTGGTGFIAAYLVKSLLEKGHTVRTTVRDPENAEKVGYLWELNGAKERLKIMKADLVNEGSFDEAVEGVDGVFHTASPVFVSHDDNVMASYFTIYKIPNPRKNGGPRAISDYAGEYLQEKLVNPCIKGTVNVLNSCKKAKSVKRVVLTSSSSSVRYRYDVGKVSPLNESHWSDPQYCTNNNLWYAYAKTIAEKEAWKFAEENGIDLVVVNPSFVVGPLLAPQPTSTLLLTLAIIKGVRGEFPNQRLGFVHIDDVVNAHVLAMEESKASGRLICSNSVTHWSEIIEMLRAKYPSYPYENKCGSQKGDDNPHSMDCSKIIKLGLPPMKTLDQMFDDCIASFQAKGLL
ncbi:Tetraketide alpha-pyrone reductase 2 [Striga hermonthica]|uniref:Tetraketide alpha-pyrone reductase 2 n=1 Tax=Striga hermonthica TaxID=68872 RepID=A0A9N7R386_STRHE|nr:Tetraketide alpha-pyrone reductase 2 [Striga hermonthica]